MPAIGQSRNCHARAKAARKQASRARSQQTARGAGSLSSQRSTLAEAAAAPTRKPTNATKGREAAITCPCPSARPSKAVLPVIADGKTSPRLKKPNASMLPDAKPSNARPTSLESTCSLGGIDIRHIRHTACPKGSAPDPGPRSRAALDDGHAHIKTESEIKSIFQAVRKCVED